MSLCPHCSEPETLPENENHLRVRGWKEEGFADHSSSHRRTSGSLLYCSFQWNRRAFRRETVRSRNISSICVMWALPLAGRWVRDLQLEVGLLCPRGEGSLRTESAPQINIAPFLARRVSSQLSATKTLFFRRTNGEEINSAH